jgi:hypothetical protein
VMAGRIAQDAVGGEAEGETDGARSHAGLLGGLGFARH